MNDELWEKAEELAAQLYAITIEHEQLSDGQTIFFVKNPDLPGCKAEGITIDEAKANLAEARVDYIHALLEEGLPIPEPPRISLIFSGAGVATSSGLFDSFQANDKTKKTEPATVSIYQWDYSQPAVNEPLVASFSFNAKP